MGLRDTFSKAAQTAFKAAGDVIEDANYYARGSTQYDASTGTASVIDSRYMVSMLFSNYAASEIDNEHVQPTDMKALIPQAKIPVIPNALDYVVRIEGTASTRYDIKSVEQDAAAATWKLQLRKP